MSKNLLTQMSYMGNIMAYYGYLHECAELFGCICRDSRYLFNQLNFDAVSAIINQKFTKCKLEFKKALTPKIAKLLVKKRIVYHYRLGISLESAMSIQAAIYLINSSSFAGSDSFYSVLIRYNLQSHKQLQEFLTQYMWRGYDLEAIEIDGRDRMNKETNFIDFISLSNPYINNKCCLKCNVLSIQSTDLCNIEKEENLLFSLKFLYFKILRINFSSIQKIKEVENLNCKTDKFDLDTPINSDSCYKLKLTDSICEIMKDIDSNLINPVAWLCRYFPKLKSVEFAIGNIIPQKILNAILPQEIQERHDLNQITNIEFNGCDIMKFFWKVSIDLQNVSFGVCLNDRVTMFHADRLLVDSLHSNCILIENPFKENNCNYLLIKNRISNIKIEGVKLDTKCSKPMYNQYSLLLNENLIEDDNEILLFIICINEKKIPKYFDVHGFIVETIIDNYRQKYYLTWPAYSPLLNKIEQIFSGIECNSLIHLNIDKSDLTFNNKNTCYFSSMVEGTNDDVEELECFKRIWTNILSRNIYDLRIEPSLGNDWLFEMILNYCSSENNNSYGRCIHDLELNLENTEDVFKFFKALDNNYMIKTLKLFTESPIKKSKEIEKVASRFRDNRISTEISLNLKNKKFRDQHNKYFETFYPDL